MTAPEQTLSQSARVDSAALAPFPASRKVYVEGSRPDIRVPMREVSLTDTPTAFGGEKNAPVLIYDTSGAYTDPAVQIDIRQGLPNVREQWVIERGDTEVLSGPTSAYGNTRLHDPELAHLRFAHLRTPRRAKSGANVTRLHYQNTVTPRSLPPPAIRRAARPHTPHAGNGPGTRPGTR